MTKIYSRIFSGVRYLDNPAIDQPTGARQIALLQTAARLVHHNAVMLVGTLYRASQWQQSNALGKRARSMRSSSIV